MAKPKPQAPPPSFADKLNEWNDKAEQIKAIQEEQQILQDEIAADMGLEPGQRRTVTYLSIGYVVTGGVRNTLNGVAVNTCTIASTPVHDEF